jgi:hypothetical protein
MPYELLLLLRSPLFGIVLLLSFKFFKPFALRATESISVRL